MNDIKIDRYTTECSSLQNRLWMQLTYFNYCLILYVKHVIWLQIISYVIHVRNNIHFSGQSIFHRLLCFSESFLNSPFVSIFSNIDDLFTVIPVMHFVINDERNQTKNKEIVKGLDIFQHISNCN